MSFALHHGQMCVLCSGCEDDEEFDYCHACGFTKLPIAADQQLAAEREAYRRQALSNHTAQDAARSTIKHLQEQLAAQRERNS